MNVDLPIFQKRAAQIAWFSLALPYWYELDLILTSLLGSILTCRQLSSTHSLTQEQVRVA